MVMYRKGDGGFLGSRDMVDIPCQNRSCPFIGHGSCGSSAIVQERGMDHNGRCKMYALYLESKGKRP